MKLTRTFVVIICIWLFLGLMNWLFWDTQYKKEQGIWGFVSALLRGALMYIL